MRGERLAALTARFSAILPRNNFSVPRDFGTLVDALPTLHVDRRVDSVLSNAHSILLTPALGKNERAASAHCDSIFLASCVPEREDGEVAVVF